jgi:putative transposase
MPRSPRNFQGGGIYHVTSRGNRKQPLYLADGDFALFLSLFAHVKGRLDWRCHGYCLIPNHYHLIVEIREENLSAGMQVLNGRYAQAFNVHYGLTGHTFQGRFHAAPVEEGGHLLELSRYLAFNPVRAGLCESPEQWSWGSYRFVVGAAPAPSFLDVRRILEYWDSNPRRARERFRRFVHD